MCSQGTVWQEGASQASVRSWTGLGTRQVWGIQTDVRVLGTWGSDRQTRRPGLWAGVGNRAEVNGASEMEGSEGPKRQVWGEPGIRDNRLIPFFFRFAGQRSLWGGGGARGSGRSSDGGGPGQTLEPPGLRGLAGGQAKQRLEDARGRAWSARKYARGRGHVGEGGFPFLQKGEKVSIKGRGREGL